MKHNQPVYFSDYFNFAEPLLLKESSSPIIKASYKNYTRLFADLLLLLQTSRTP